MHTQPAQNLDPTMCTHSLHGTWTPSCAHTACTEPGPHHVHTQPARNLDPIMCTHGLHGTWTPPCAHTACTEPGPHHVHTRPARNLDPTMCTYMPIYLVAFVLPLSRFATVRFVHLALTALHGGSRQVAS